MAFQLSARYTKDPTSWARESALPLLPTLCPQPRERDGTQEPRYASYQESGQTKDHSREARTIAPEPKAHPEQADASKKGFSLAKQRSPQADNGHATQNDRHNHSNRCLAWRI